MIAYALSQKGLLQMPLNALGQPDGDKAFSSLVAQLLPIGFKGVVVCGLLAALMSSLASLFNSSAALFVEDFYKKFRKSCSDLHYVVVGKIATGAVVVLGILWIPVMKGIGNVLYRYLQAVQGLLAPAIAVAFIFGVFWKRASRSSGLWSLAVGFSLGMFRLALDVIIGSKVAVAKSLAAADVPAALAAIQAKFGLLYSIEMINWLHYTEALFVICALTVIVVSLLSKAPAPETVRFTMSGATAEEKAATRKSWNAWDVVHTVIVIGIVVAFYIYFW